MGALTDIPALQQFCLVAALAVLADFLLQVGKRGDNRARCYCLPRSWSIPCHPDITLSSLFEKYITLTHRSHALLPAWPSMLAECKLIDTTAAPASSDPSLKRRKARRAVVVARKRGRASSAASSTGACALRASRSRRGEAAGDPSCLFSWLPQASTHRHRHYIPALFSPTGKALVLLLGAALLACGLYGLTALEVMRTHDDAPIQPSVLCGPLTLFASHRQLGLEPQLAAPSGHYLIDYYNAQFSMGEAGGWVGGWAVNGCGVSRVPFSNQLTVSHRHTHARARPCPPAIRPARIPGDQGRGLRRQGVCDSWEEGEEEAVEILSALLHIASPWHGIDRQPTPTRLRQVVRDSIRKVSTRLAQLGRFVQPPIYSWMDAVESYMGNENLPGDCPK